MRLCAGVLEEGREVRRWSVGGDGGSWHAHVLIAAAMCSTAWDYVLRSAVILSVICGDSVSSVPASYIVRTCPFHIVCVPSPCTLQT
jgi:hypothetical protein